MRRHHRKDLGDKFSEGARLLWLFKERAGMSNDALRKLCGGGCDVARHLYGDRAPGREAMRIYRDRCDIPLDAWLQEPRRGFRLPALRRAA